MIRLDLAALENRSTAIWIVAGDFDAAIRPALLSLERNGETWLGARLWQKTAEFYQRGLDMLADFGREAMGYWQRLVTDRDTERDSDGPER